jgi:hypothetical protein
MLHTHSQHKNGKKRQMLTEQNLEGWNKKFNRIKEEITIILPM